MKTVILSIIGNILTTVFFVIPNYKINPQIAIFVLILAILCSLVAFGEQKGYKYIKGNSLIIINLFIVIYIVIVPIIISNFFPDQHNPIPSEESILQERPPIISTKEVSKTVIKKPIIKGRVFIYTPGQRIPVRVGPGQGYKQIDELENGVKVVILETIEGDLPVNLDTGPTVNNRWYRIDYKKGKNINERIKKFVYSASVIPNIKKDYNNNELEIITDN